MSNYVGFDIGGTNIRMASMKDGRPEFRATVTLPASYVRLLDILSAEIRSYREAGAAVEGIGIGLPGVAFAHEVQWIPNISYLDGTALAQDLEARSGAPVFLANDAHLALLGEARFGAASNARNALLLSIGTGVGGAVLIGNRIYRGASGAAGSFGWVNLGLASPLHTEHGQLELLASGTALTETAAEQGITAKALITAARRGEREAVTAVEQMAQRLGLAIASLVSTFDPEVVLISGGVSSNFDMFEKTVNGTVQLYASPAGRRVPICRAGLGEQSGAFGAVVLAKERERGFLN